MKALAWIVCLASVLMGCQSRDLNFFIRFQEVDGLEAGDRVYLAGREVGQVETIQPVEDGSLWVAVQIRAPHGSKVTGGSRYTIEPDPVRPRRQSIWIAPNPEGEPIKEGAVVEGSEPMAELFGPILRGFGESMEALQKEFQGLSRELEKIPQSPEFQNLQRRLENLMEEMREAEKKMERDVLPRLKEEMERLREEMEKSRPEKKPAPSEREPIDL
ncbi:MlaD family protein [Methylohalobius crimeensis]|uniref:MlaD family protein n=1 Tax=Methylohalobius crimeensis TaxID=244365 RepID=UPI0003B4FA67|nr:MlaD family protein [Methylohalobius crimeensis]